MFANGRVKFSVTMELSLNTVAIAIANLVAMLVLRHIGKIIGRPKYHAASRITWKGYVLNWALWPETLLKRKPNFRKMTLEALKKSAMKNAKGLTDFG